MSYATEKASGLLSGMLAKRESLPPAEWLEKHVRMIDPNRNIDGPIRFHKYPYAREPTEACCDPGVPQVALCFSAQMLKTTILKMAAAYTFANRQLDAVWTMDSLDNARDFSKSRWRPFLLNSEKLAELVPENEDDFGNVSQYLRNGALFFVGSNSVGKAASKPCGLIVCDEIDKWPATHRKEAGTLDLLRERLAGNAAGMEWDASTPTYAEGTIWTLFQQLDQRHRYGPCPNCNEPFRLEFSAPQNAKDVGWVSWDQSARAADGTWKIHQAAASAHIVCPHCGFHMLDKHKRAFDRAGEWIPLNDNPKRRGRSYRINRLYSPMPAASLSNVVRYHLMAERDPSARQTFSNSWLAEAYEEETQSQDEHGLMEHTEDYPLDPLPDGVLFLTCGVDVQKGKANDSTKPPRLEAEIVGWGDGYESWGIEKRVFAGDPTDLGDMGPWKRLDQWLRKPRNHLKRGEMRSACTLIDSGWMPEPVYSFCASRAQWRVYPSKGKTPGQSQDPIISRPSESNIKHVKVHMVSRYSGNVTLFTWMKITKPGPGYMHFPADPSRGYDLEHFAQMTAEKLVTRRVAGRSKQQWVDGGRSTEALAIRRNALAAAILLNPDFEALKKLTTDAKRGDRNQ